VFNIAAADPASSYALLPHRDTIPVNFEEPAIFGQARKPVS